MSSIMNHIISACFQKFSSSIFGNFVASSLQPKRYAKRSRTITITQLRQKIQTSYLLPLANGMYLTISLQRIQYFRRNKAKTISTKAYLNTNNKIHCKNHIPKWREHKIKPKTVPKSLIEYKRLYNCKITAEKSTYLYYYQDNVKWQEPNQPNNSEQIFNQVYGDLQQNND